ncbi:IS110 family transposase [Butyrivibrio sp. FC2001]|uniref:IS110 family transposase n=1 Tax=Butyrivibrio sp. FC2001 TaxID=1280671 RepID=UPI00210136AE
MHNNLKNDYVDSFIIADCLRFGRINKEVYLDDYRYKALQNLTRARYVTVQNLTKEKQRFMNVLFKKYSSFTQEKVFSDKFGATALALLLKSVNINHTNWKSTRMKKNFLNIVKSTMT